MHHPLHPHSGEEPRRPLRDAEVEALLARVPRPPARGAFRDATRLDFLGGKLRSGAPSGEDLVAVNTTSQDRTPVRTEEPDVEYLEENLARTPIASPASGEFRAELKRAFVTGEFVEGAGFEDEAATPAGKLLRFLLPVAAVAAILAVTFFTPGFLEERAWDARILGAGSVEVAGVTLGPRELARLGAEATLGGPIVVGASALQLELDGRLVLEIQPETTLRLEPIPAAGSGGKLVVRIERGEAFLKTLEDGIDFPVLFTTDEAWVRVVGTALGVLALEDGTCVCVSQGQVRVTDRTAESVEHDVLEDHTLFIHRGAADPPELVPFGKDPQHTGDLLEFTLQ